MSMTSVERLNEYTLLDQEAPAHIPTHQPPPYWPSKGHIKIKDLQIRHNPDLSPAVNLNRCIEMMPGQNIVLVGRTGSGKSTLGSAFMRFLEFHSGFIEIDGINISDIGLRDLYVFFPI